MAETKVRPAGSRSLTWTLVAASGPLLVRVTVKVIVSPTLGVGSLTVLASARSACCGVSVALAVLLAVLGSNWSEWVIVAVLVCGDASCDRGLDRERLPSRRWPPSPTSRARSSGRRSPGCGVADDERQPGGQQVGHLHVGGGVGAVVGQGDGVGDRVAHVGGGVADRLGQRQVGLLRRHGRRWPCCCSVLGSNWSEWVMVAVLVCAVGDGDGRRDASASAG